MYKNKLILSSLLAFFCFLMVIGSVTATDNSTLGDDLAIAENYSSQNQLNSIEETDTLNSAFNENSLQKSSLDQNLTISEVNENNQNTTANVEILTKTNNESNLSIDESSNDEILSNMAILTSVVDIPSQSNTAKIVKNTAKGHTYHKVGYAFKVSANQYKKIRKAINYGKKHKFLDWGFEFKVKTNKIHKYKKPIYKNKKVTAYKWKYKKISVSQETYWKWDYRFYTDKTKTKNGWICYKLSQTDYEYGVPYTHYVHFKKKVKYITTKKVKTGRYKTVNMRIYANIIYVGSEDYVTGQHAYFPWVSFQAMKSGYKTIYLNGLLLK